MDNQERERRIKELEALFEPDGGDPTKHWADIVMDWHLKEVEKAEARGMKKAAERIEKAINTGNILASPLDKQVAMEVECIEIIIEANKTLEAE